LACLKRYSVFRNWGLTGTYNCDRRVTRGRNHRSHPDHRAALDDAADTQCQPCPHAVDYRAVTDGGEGLSTAAVPHQKPLGRAH
ncbi:MAG: hypothetical protein ACK56I_11220, partial [bacterium]